MYQPEFVILSAAATAAQSKKLTAPGEDPTTPLRSAQDDNTRYSGLTGPVFGPASRAYLVLSMPQINTIDRKCAKPFWEETYEKSNFP